jgi:hypothetical protein
MISSRKPKKEELTKKKLYSKAYNYIYNAHITRTKEKKIV